jgi:uncharacterized protein YbjT (DUF2867 family)
MKFLVAGATGLVGKEMVRILLDRPGTEMVFALSRSPQSSNHPLLQWITGKMPPESLPEADTLVIALGTTIAKDGSKEAFWGTDVELPLQIEKLALEAGCKTLLLVSAKGANAGSFIFYYKAKGTLEEKSKSIGFDTICVVRPSLLLGKREENRPGEKWAQKILGPIRNCLPASLRPVLASEVAMSLLNGQEACKIKTIENQEIIAGNNSITA